MGSYGIWDLGSDGPKVELWDRDEDWDGWGPMGCGIWGRMDDQIWRYGAQGWMGIYGMWDLGSGGPEMDIWDRDGRIWGSGMNGVLWDLGFGVGWPQNGWGGAV